MRTKGWKRWVRELPWGVIGLLVVLRIGVVEANYVPSGSMRPTIEIGDVLVVDKTAYGLALPFKKKLLLQWDTPKRGEIVTFFPDHTGDRLVKRVIGVGGDVVASQRGVLIVNGEPVAATQMFPHMTERLEGMAYNTFFSAFHDFGPLRVPEGNLFVMGDNRPNSADSRFWGFLPVDQVRGKARFRLFSLSWFQQGERHVPFGGLHAPAQ